MGINAPFTRSLALRVNRHHDTLIPKCLGAFINHLGAENRRRIHSYLVGTGQQHTTHISYLANTTTHRQWHETLCRGFTHHINHGITTIRGGCNIQKNNLISLLLIVGNRGLHRISSIDKINKIGPLNNPAICDVEAGNDSLRKHTSDLPAKLRKARHDESSLTFHYVSKMKLFASFP